MQRVRIEQLGHHPERGERIPPPHPVLEAAAILEEKKHPLAVHLEHQPVVGPLVSG